MSRVAGWTADSTIVNFPVLIGSMALVVVAAFLTGWWLGSRSEVQRRVDAALRRETRLRHPSERAPLVRAPNAQEAADRIGGVSLGALIDAERRERGW